MGDLKANVLLGRQLRQAENLSDENGHIQSSHGY